MRANYSILSARTSYSESYLSRPLAWAVCQILREAILVLIVTLIDVVQINTRNFFIVEVLVCTTVTLRKLFGAEYWTCSYAWSTSEDAIIVDIARQKIFLGSSSAAPDLLSNVNKSTITLRVRLIDREQCTRRFALRSSGGSMGRSDRRAFSMRHGRHTKTGALKESGDTFKLMAARKRQGCWLRCGHGIGCFKNRVEGWRS